MGSTTRQGSSSRLGGVPVALPPESVAANATRQMAWALDVDTRAPVPNEVLPGVVHIPNWLDLDAQRVLADDFRAWARPPAGLRCPRVPTGHLMSVQAVCLGWHWYPYVYSRTADDTDGAPVKPLPDSLSRLARAAVADTYGAGSPEAVAFSPDAAIVNLYPEDAKLGLHQDGEEPSEAPVVTISIGDRCTFRLAGTDRRVGPFTDVDMGSGDLLVFGRENRRIFHGVPKVFPDTGPDGLGLPRSPQHHGARNGFLVSAASIRGRVDGFDWPQILAGLDDVGVCLTPPALEAEQCRALVALYRDDTRFRSTIDMGRHRFGEGQYRYFGYPLPELVGELRAAFWPHLLPIAREWADRRGQRAPWPDDLDDWLEQCHAAGQTRPTPLMLRYEAGDWNALHRDLYGDLVFPLQVAVGLSQPGEDFTGGEFVVVEQRPRAQSRATTAAIPLGHALVFTTRDRPIRTSRGWSNASMRHGVSTVHSGERLTLGVIFHDAT